MVDRSRAGWARHFDDDPQDRPARGGRHRVTVAAAVAVFVVLAALITLVLLDTTGPRGGGTSTAPTQTSAASVSLPGGPAAGRAVPGGSQPLTAAPAGVQWQLDDGLALPVSKSDGPARVTDGVPSGFAHTPTGALLACIQIGFRLGSINPSQQAAVVRAMVTGAGQAAILASRPAAVLAVKPQLAGFRYLSYTPQSAVIGFAWRITDTATNTSRFLGVGELQAIWVRGDWRLLDDGTPAPPPTPLDPALTGYVPFAGA